MEKEHIVVLLRTYERFLLRMNTLAKPQELPRVSQRRGSWAIGCYGRGFIRCAATPCIDDLVARDIRPMNFNVEAQCSPKAEVGVTT